MNIWHLASKSNLLFPNLSFIQISRQKSMPALLLEPIPLIFLQVSDRLDKELQAKTTLREV